MPPRPVMLAGLLGAAVGVPYAVDQADTWNTGQAATTQSADQTVTGAASPQPGNVMAEIGMPASPGDQLYGRLAPLEGLPSYSLSEVLRLDVSKEWVYRRWARKSTGLAEVDLFGIRVPLVSGTRMTDIAGSLTYYFDRSGKVVKLRLVGKTADTTQLVNLLAHRHGFRPATPQVAGEQLYQVNYNGRVESQLRTWPESVLWDTSPHNSFSVELEINRPRSGRYVRVNRLELPQLQTPQDPSANLLNAQPSGPAEPMLPSESVVPSAGSDSQANSTESSAPQEAQPPKKQPKSPLRWPS